MKRTNLSKYNNNWYNPGNTIKRTLWYFVNAVFFICPLNPSSGIKKILLKLFGANIGAGVVIKPGINIKYPWKLNIGENTWIGEKVWIDNLEQVNIGSNCCLSQGAVLLCGNHNYKKETFDLMVGNITLEDGVWIGAQAMLTPGTLCKTHAVLSVQSVGSGILESYSVYRGNPAVKVKDRIIE
ncbi:putative colanic acid biosynthesis acetyltransferase WcaF [Saccharicrinis carchari]|uniref:Putative colanic acid biosynthesis acetyltransferase WcaF n=1 Tax=Saccharicrinis carchari TaxID=1168039 RepID=A0A521B108_SACCC|nr:WcaF family extracellular polysaccharide biosynthesis acetyltransferase [Saccharicrinis carchari]SMO40772.1 putative colanic acid biosynthesis acetyltransferase WcaF [Saccharicrinis carchari]